MASPASSGSALFTRRLGTRRLNPWSITQTRLPRRTRSFVCPACVQQQHRHYILGRSARDGVLLSGWRTRTIAGTNATRFSVHQRRYAEFATATIQAEDASTATAESTNVGEEGQKVIGPLEQYDQWVAKGKLRDDEFQRQIISRLQQLHRELIKYEPPKVVHPQIEELQKPTGMISSWLNRHSWNPKHDQDKNREEANVMFLYDPAIAPKIFNLSGLFHRKKPPPPKTNVDVNTMPKGLYLYGDVGSGKTMLMNMFYHTLPPNIVHKKRIHFHQFMQDTHRRLHMLKVQHGSELDAIPYVAADVASEASVLCFDEFQCTDVADAMILRRLVEEILSHGVVIISTSNRQPDDLYKNGIQRESFIPCIELLKTRLEVVNLDSPTDYRKIAKPPAGVYHHPLDASALTHANKWFSYLGDPKDPPHPAKHIIWGREVKVPLASGRAARFTFDDLCVKPLSAADYLELTKHYNAFVITDVPELTFNMRDLARRFITFIDAVYEARATIVVTSQRPIAQAFIGDEVVKEKMDEMQTGFMAGHMRMLMDDLGLDMKTLKESSIFTGDEEKFASARAVSRLTEMGAKNWRDYENEM